MSSNDVRIVRLTALAAGAATVALVCAGVEAALIGMALLFGAIAAFAAPRLGFAAREGVQRRRQHCHERFGMADDPVRDWSCNCRASL